MTSLKNKNKIFLILLGLGVVIISTALFFTGDSCGIQHIFILNDLDVYESSLDPEYCEELVERIDSYNLECKPKVEILDCG